MNRSKVAVLYTKPESVLDDYERLLDLAGARQTLDPAAPTILKDNISWHLPMPSANTTPWQLEGTITGLRALQDLIFKTPLVNIPILISEVEHDRLHWPLKERGVFHRWRDETPWGGLFRRYAAEGALRPPGD